ncbi:TNF receptor-associated factor 6-A-like [Clytia hemisphaerica]|uniref:Uncharacterized protein n=1 Tax=Clytia hemisphaerica TaxID=252671 RepID=A0A7M5V2I2_9CNID
MDNLGGFDVEFVLEEKDDLKCSICLLVLREPMQAEQCGHRFCKGCVINLPKSDKKGYICPIDRSKMTMETHLIQKCAKAPTECGFAHLGCEKRMLMYDIGKHNQNFSVQHMNLALQKIHEQQSEIRKMADDLQNQKAEIMRLNESLLTECWKTNVTKSDRHLWKIMGFSNEVKKVHEWKRDNIQTISFYTFQGYHIKVDLYPNYRSGKHLAIFAYTVVGEFDEDLKWPMDKTTLKFTVLIKDRRSWATVYRITTDKNHYKIAAFQKPPHIAPCFGTTQFIKHRSLSEFLYNDSLTIKITVINHVLNN